MSRKKVVGLLLAYFLIGLSIGLSVGGWLQPSPLAAIGLCTIGGGFLIRT